MTSHRSSWIVIAALTGCSASAAPPAPVDAGDYCPPIAGTCAQAFFYVASSCFAPSSACVEQNATNPPGIAKCWDNGARVYSYFDAGGANHAVWLNAAGQVCMSQQIDSKLVAHLSAGDRKLDDDLSTGIVTCPDGTTVHVGASAMFDPAVCPELDTLLLGGCQGGTCARAPE